jgi:prevent-host-death family protein
VVEADMTYLDIQDARKRFHELMELVDKGEEIIITRNDEPFAKVTPIVSIKSNRQFGSAKGQVWIAEDFDEPLKDFEEYS